MNKKAWGMLGGILFLSMMASPIALTLDTPTKGEGAYYVLGCGSKGGIYFNEFVRHDNGVTATVAAYYQPAFLKYEFVEDEPYVVDIGEIRSNKR